MTDTAEVKTATMETTSALPAEETERMSGEIVAALKTVFDPEIPADIYELGLIYKVDLKDDRSVDILMTLTTPNCPAAGELPQMVENAVASVPGGRRRQRQSGVGSGLDAGPDVGRGAPRPQYVVMR
ncbi:metal-sulfur cluster biosynthetic enzyme [Bradyrhizobium sp. JR3.5]